MRIHEDEYHADVTHQGTAQCWISRFYTDVYTVEVYLGGRRIYRQSWPTLRQARQDWYHCLNTLNRGQQIA